MKPLFILIVLLSAGFNICAKAPARIIYNFEGFAYNGKGQFIANTKLQLRIWIRNNKAGGAIIYDETQAVKTNEKGLFFVHIGIGEVISGTMEMMASESDSRFMKIEMSAVGEMNVAGPVSFKCVKCRRCTDRYIPGRVTQAGI